MSQAAWDAYEMEFRAHERTVKERDEAERKLDEALKEIKRLKKICAGDYP